MTRAAESDLERFLTEHPEIRFFDAFVNDLNTVERGKRIDRAGIAGGVQARHAPARLDVRARYRGRHGRRHRPRILRWRCRSALHADSRLAGAGALGEGRHRAGAAHDARSRRHAVSSAIRVTCSPTCSAQLRAARAHARGGDRVRVLSRRRRTRCATASRSRPAGRSPVAASTARRSIRWPISTSTHRCSRRSIACAALQDVPTTSALAEYGPGQYEVNLAHCAGLAARLRPGAALQARREERRARAWLRRDVPAEALSRHGRQRPAHSREPARRGGRNIFAAANPLESASAAPRDRRHPGDARRRHGDVRARPEFVSPLSLRGVRARCIRPGRSTIAARRCACPPPTPTICASSTAWPARMRILTSFSRGSSPACCMASRLEARAARRVHRQRVHTGRRSAADELASGHRAFRRERIRARNFRREVHVTSIPP